MDNLCHTLVGAALAETGLKRRTRLGAATLMIGANFPDVDVATVPFGRAIGMRRGTRWCRSIASVCRATTARYVGTRTRSGQIGAGTPGGFHDRFRPLVVFFFAFVAICLSPFR